VAAAGLGPVGADLSGPGPETRPQSGAS